MFVLIDDCSRYMWTALLKEKSEAFEKFKTFKVLAEQETHTELKNLRTDRGGEFCSREFQAYCERNDIKRHLTGPYSPQQNGVVERHNRTLLEVIRSILKHMNLPNHLWGEAIRHCTYLINRVVTRSLEGTTPYEDLKSRKPNLSHVKVFGCVCYARIERAGRKNLDDRSRTLVHLGIEPGSKAYRLFDPLSKCIVVSRDVVFEEEKSLNWTKDDNGDPGELEVDLSRLIVNTNEDGPSSPTNEVEEELDNGNNGSSKEDEVEPLPI